jgi:hypothetical protein
MKTTPYERISRHLSIIAFASEPRFFSVGPLTYDTKLAWKLVDRKIIRAPIEPLPIEHYLKYVGFDPSEGQSSGFKLHLDKDIYEALSPEEANKPGLVVRSEKLGAILISGNMNMAWLYKNGVHRMNVHVISVKDEPMVLHGSDAYKRALKEYM